MRQSRFGQPLALRGKSASSTFVVSPVGGYRTDVPPTNLPPGFTPDAQNYIVRESALEPRPMLQQRATYASVRNSPILGGTEAVDVIGASFPFASHATNPVWYSSASWSQLSYTSAAGISDPPDNSASTLWDMTQVYGYPMVDQNVVLMASPSYQSLYCWEIGSTVYSTLTGAPRARAVAIFDNYVLAFNIREGTNDFVQRVQWSDRGSVSSWTDPNSLIGSLDILDAKGYGTRLLPQEDRCVAFTSKEVWELRSVGLPTIFDYRAVDRSVGCPFPQTAVDTPQGIIFLGNDYNIYLLPRGGGSATPIGTGVYQTLRETIDYPHRAWGLYNRETNQYELHYCAIGDSFPAHALSLDLGSGAWMPQVYAQELSYGWMGSLGTSSIGTRWSDLATIGITWAQLSSSWAGLQGSAGVGPLAAYAGSSHGTLYYLSSGATNDDGQAVTCRWRSHAMVGQDPTAQKTMTEVRLDYQADSTSTVTVQFSGDVGASFVDPQGVSLPTSSVESQVRVHPYLSARYPMFEVTQDVGKTRLFRFHVTHREQGR